MNPAIGPLSRREVVSFLSSFIQMKLSSVAETSERYRNPIGVGVGVGVGVGGGVGIS